MIVSWAWVLPSCKEIVRAFGLSVETTPRLLFQSFTTYIHCFNCLIVVVLTLSVLELFWGYSSPYRRKDCMIAFIPLDHLLLTLFGSLSQSFGGRYYTDFCLDDSISTVLPLIVLHLSLSTDSLIRTPFTALLSIAAKCHRISPYRNWQSELELTTKTKKPSDIGFAWLPRHSCEYRDNWQNQYHWVLLFSVFYASWGG